MATVELKGIEKSLGGQPVLRGVELAIADRELVVLVGPSGCGKTTLLRLLAGLEELSQGEIWIGGRRVDRLPPAERDIAMVFQGYALYPHMTVRENLAFGLTLRHVPRVEIARRVDEVAAMLGLGELLARRPRDLSGGQRQRVAMGRAIVRRPAVFLFDEPLSNLDASLRTQVRIDLAKLLRQLGATAVYVTHDQVEAMTLADRLAVLREGRLQQQGRPLDLFDRPGNRFVAGFLGSPAMGFLRATAKLRGGGARGEGEGFSLELPEVAGLSEGQAIWIGLRPHDLALSVSPPPPGRGLEAIVEGVEPIGWEAHVLARVGGVVLTARAEASRATLLPVGSRLQLAVQPSALRLFDVGTELAISAAALPHAE